MADNKIEAALARVSANDPMLINLKWGANTGSDEALMRLQSALASAASSGTSSLERIGLSHAPFITAAGMKVVLEIVQTTARRVTKVSMFGTPGYCGAPSSYTRKLTALGQEIERVCKINEMALDLESLQAKSCDASATDLDLDWQMPHPNSVQDTVWPNITRREAVQLLSGGTEADADDAVLEALAEALAHNEGVETVLTGVVPVGTTTAVLKATCWPDAQQSAETPDCFRAFHRDAAAKSKFEANQAKVKQIKDEAANAARREQPSTNSCTPYAPQQRTLTLTYSSPNPNEKPYVGPYVGLVRRPGHNTCYLNSLLQVLFHNALVRDQIFASPASPSPAVDEQKPKKFMSHTFGSGAAKNDAKKAKQKIEQKANSKYALRSRSKYGRGSKREREQQQQFRQHQYHRQQQQHWQQDHQDHQIQMQAPSIPAALQQLFAQLTNDTKPVATTTLTRAFGWGSGESSMQQDGQEAMMMLLEAVKSCSAQSKCDEIFEFQTRFTTLWSHECKTQQSSRTFKESTLLLEVPTATSMSKAEDKEADASKPTPADTPSILDALTARFGQNEEVCSENPEDALEAAREQGHGQVLTYQRQEKLIADSLPPVLTVMLKRFQFVEVNRTAAVVPTGGASASAAAAAAAAAEGPVYEPHKVHDCCEIEPQIGEKTVWFSHLCSYQNDHFTKTGSGQT